MVSFWIDYGTNNIGGTGPSQSDAAWMVPICLQLLPGIALGVGMLFMPFSPRWLLHHGRESEARHVLSSLRGLSENHELIELEFLEIKAQSVFEKRSTAEKMAAPSRPYYLDYLQTAIRSHSFPLQDESDVASRHRRYGSP